MGIIAGIAIPTTIAVINRQKKNAATKSADTILNAAKQVLLEAAANGNTGDLSYVEDDHTATAAATKYTVTSAALADNGELEKDPVETGSATFTVEYIIADTSFNVSCAGCKINGYYISWTSDDGFSASTTATS